MRQVELKVKIVTHFETGRAEKGGQSHTLKTGRAESEDSYTL